MKILHLLRHAKSDWSKGAESDHDRPIGSRGKRSAKELAGFLRSKEIQADMVFVSDSKRTLQTFKSIQKRHTISQKIIVSNEVYLADKEALLEIIKKIDELKNSALILGHNPSLEDFACYLIGEGNRVFAKFPTASFLTLQLDIDSWIEISEGCGKILQFWIPKKESL